MLPKNHMQVLNYIYKHPRITNKKLKRKFKDNRRIFPVFLAHEGYIVITQYNEDGSYFDPRNNPEDRGHTPAKETYMCSNKGRIEIEQWKRESLKWAIPTVISVIALLISIFK